MADDARGRLHDFEDSFTERKLEGTANRAELRKTIVAFANSVPEGRTGILYIGIANDGSIHGVKQPDTLQQKIRQVCEQDCYPKVTARPEVLIETEKAIVAVVVPYSPNRPHFAGPAYVRIGSQSVIASEEVFGQLITCRLSKPREILKWKNRAVTIVAIGKILGRTTVVSGNAETRHECFVLDCTPHIVRLQIIGADRYVSESLEDVSISYDETRNRLMLIIRGR